MMQGDSGGLCGWLWSCAAAACCWLCLLLCCNAAGAAVIHDPRSTITDAIVPPGSSFPATLTSVNAMTVDSGVLYVAEGRVESRVDEFDAASGALLAQLPQVASLSYLFQGVAVGHRTGETEIYVGGDEEAASGPAGAVAVFGAGGNLQAVWRGQDTPGGGFGCFECRGPGDVAVDDSGRPGDWARGDVYVSVPTEDVVDVFKPLAHGGEEYVTQLTGSCFAPGPCMETTPFVTPTGVAVSSFDGEVLVVDNHEAVDLFSPSRPGQYDFAGRLAQTPAGPLEKVESVTADGADGDIYVAEKGTVVEFDAQGEYLGQIAGPERSSYGQGEYLGQIAGGSGEPFNDAASVAVNPQAPHQVFVGDDFKNERSVEEGGAIYAYGPNRLVPNVKTGSSGELTPTNASVEGSVDPVDAGSAGCRFAWGVGEELDDTAPCATPIAQRSDASTVHGSVTDLRPDVEYCYRLQASNANGSNPGEAWQDRCFHTPGPGIRGEWSLDVTSSSAILDAAIDPNGRPTSYYFQLGTGTRYGAKVPLSASALGSGSQPLTVSQTVRGLRAQTLYHYRVLAISRTPAGVRETFYGPDETLTTQPAGAVALPEPRRLEAVSAPGGQDELVEAPDELDSVQAAASGDALAYVARRVSAGGGQNAGVVQVLASRGPGGWSSRDLALPGETLGGFEEKGSELRVFTEDLSLGVMQPFGPLTSTKALATTGASEQTPFLRAIPLGAGSSCGDSCERPLVTGAPGHADVPRGTRFDQGEECAEGTPCGPRFLGGSPNLQHLVIESLAALTPDGPHGQAGLYEWTDGRLTFVSHKPDGTPANDPRLGQLEEGANGAVSEDGTHVVWEAEHHLYLTDTAKNETLELSAIQGGNGAGDPVARFQFASRDGSRIFFLNGSKLTRNSQGSPFAHGGDLYECAIVEVAGKIHCDLSDLTPARPDEHSDVERMIGASEDGSWVYFIANDTLAPGSIRGKCQGQFAPPSSLCDLYVEHDGTTRLVAVVTHHDAPDWGAAHGQPSLTARVSPNGQWLAFMSQRELTGADTHDAITGQPDEEVYLYDAATGKLVCASCTPTGERPTGVAVESLGSGIVAHAQAWKPGASLAADLPGWTPYASTHSFYQSRYLENDGTLFFDSDDALVPQDTNHTWDVYEYEPLGMRACSRADRAYDARSQGCIGLVSTGHTPDESGFLDAGTSGEDAFFLSFPSGPDGEAPQVYDSKTLP
jgi:hypothetical protein